MENENLNCCENCVYFSQHYIRYGQNYIPIECGTCMCEKLSGEERKQFGILEGCGYFKEK